MFDIFNTIPPWKMPDEEIIQEHTHYVKMRIEYKSVQQRYPNGLIRTEYVADLSEYYNWAKENKIFMEHNPLIYSKIGSKSLLMFVFKDAIDAMAFKLRWT